MLKPGKISIFAACAAMLGLLAACDAGRDSVPMEPNPPPLEITAGADQPSEALPNQDQDSPEQPSEDSVEESSPIPFFVPDSDTDDPDGAQTPEPVEEPNPIPFFVPDSDTDDPGGTQTPEPVRISIPIPYIKTENAAPAVSRKVSDPDKFEDDTQYFGRWIVQSCGIDVACYLSLSQDVVDSEDAAAFFQLGDQYVIGDHSNQDFISLGSCQPGDLACLETADGIAVYVCTAIVQGHNLEKAITDDAGNSIEYGFNTGGITCYTCNDNWRNIHIVLFSPIA